MALQPRSPSTRIKIEEIMVLKRIFRPKKEEIMQRRGK
jgi:hypothetical protein